MLRRSTYGILIALVASSLQAPAQAQSSTPAPATQPTPVVQPQGVVGNLKQFVKSLVNVEVQDQGGGQTAVHVKAPFVDVQTGDHVRVKAPFVHVEQPLSGTPITPPATAANAPTTPSPTATVPATPAPTTTPQASAGSVSVNAPFVHVTQDANGTQVKAPFVNVNRAPGN